jgi:hypothetical protein
MQVGDAASTRCYRRAELIIYSLYRDAKKTLPKPKVGDYCSVAMEQAFSDVCLPLCMEERVVSRIAAACRGAAVEQPVSLFKH